MQGLEEDVINRIISPARRATTVDGGCVVDQSGHSVVPSGHRHLIGTLNHGINTIVARGTPRPDRTSP